jgi:hypothetical protein
VLFTAGDLTLHVSVCGGRFEQLGLSQCTINTTDPTVTPTITFTARMRTHRKQYLIAAGGSRGSAGAAGSTCCFDRRRLTPSPPPHPPWPPHVCRPQVNDNGGGSASVVRTLKIIPSCADGEALCPDNACSKGGLCKDATPAVPPPPNQPPVLALITSEALLSTVKLKKGGVYTACNGGAVPTSDRPCDLGVTATDEEDGDLGTKVRAVCCRGLETAHASRLRLRLPRGPPGMQRP